jgi:hypothetical protein
VTPLRQRMTEDMRTAGMASGTQALYLDAVRNLAAHYRRSPDELSEEEVLAYLLSLRERGVALSTFKGIVTLTWGGRRDCEGHRAVAVMLRFG